MDCSLQFRSKYVFAVMARFDKSVQLEWHYHQAHHGLSNDLEPFHGQYYSRAKHLCAITQVQRAKKMNVVFVKNFIIKMKRGFSFRLARYGSMKNVSENNFLADLKDA